MKTFVRTLLAWKLALLSKWILRKYDPTIVMVTGSVGKTSTKDAIAAVLGHHFHVRASEKSYNSEFGVPLTILGVKNPWASPVAWAHTFGEAWALLLLPNVYPKVLVLEVGADRPGDLARILSITTPDAVVVTRLPEVPVHVEAYASPEAVREEEFAPAYALQPGAPLIINADDEYAVAMAARLSAKTITFGTREGAAVRMSDPRVALADGTPTGMEADVTVEGENHMLTVEGALGRPQLYAPLAALALATAFEMTPAHALEGLRSYVPPAGRGRILSGKGGSVILDDSYNASPAAVEEALLTLTELKKAAGMKRTIAVLGDMLELGRYSHTEHERIGALAAAHADVLVVVGIRARSIAEGARAAGMGEDAIQSFGTSTEAALALAPTVGEGDIVLVKGSQGVRTERVAEALLADPADVRFLVRQDKEWKRR